MFQPCTGSHALRGNVWASARDKPMHSHAERGNESALRSNEKQGAWKQERRFAHASTAVCWCSGQVFSYVWLGGFGLPSRCLSDSR